MAAGLAGRRLEALRPSPRVDTGTVRAHPELFAEAAALRLELPGRSAAQIASILFHRHGIRVAERTVRARLRRAGLHREALAAEPKTYGRYEAARLGERWISDVLVGPRVPYPRREGSVRARLFLIVDDHSRLLQPDQLEELRLLTNAEMDSASPFAGVLAGQPTLNRQLRMGTFAALDQRIATRFPIKPMDLAESAAYLRHHLTLAGREEPLFADDAIARLHRVASGLPRALNAAAAALIAAAAAGKDLVDDACAKKAVAELTRD